MRDKQIKRILACALVLCMALALLPATAYAVSQDDIDQLKAERNKISAQREEKQAVVDELEARQASVLERKQAMDERNMLTLQQIQSISEEIGIYDDMISDKAKEVAEAQRLEDEQLERYRARVRAMEENGNLGFLALVLNTSNLGELLTAIDDVGEIMASDRELEDEYIAAREQTELVKAEYEEVREDLEKRKDDLRLEQELLELEIEEANEVIYALMQDIEANSAELEELMAAEDEADARVAELVAQFQREQAEAEERRRQQQAATGGSSGGGGGGGGSVSGTGSFIWPAPSTTYCTSRFGYRIHPVTGVGRNHNGLDVGAGYGSTILASDGGTAHTYYNDGGYGYYVMIDHGNGYQTLYGHMSAYAISDGQAVSQGDVIGYVGSSGLVTGPHLHFEIWSGGGRIDPEQFFSGLTFASDAGV